MNDIAKGTEWGKVEVTIQPQFFPDLKIMIDNRGFLNQESRELLKEALRKGKDVRITAFTFHHSFWYIL